MSTSELLPEETLQSTQTTLSSDFSRVEARFNDIQNQILQQGKEIEDFIQYRGAKNQKSQSFMALQALFKAFKTELSMNLTLRQVLLEEKGETQKCNESLTNLTECQQMFFKSVSHITKQKLMSFESVLDYIQDKSTNKHATNYKGKCDEYRRKIRKLEQKLDELNAQTIDMASLRAQSESTATQNEMLRRRISYLENMLSNQTISSTQSESMVQEISFLRSKNSEQEVKIKNLGNSLREREKDKNKLANALAAEQQRYQQSIEVLKRAEAALRTAHAKALDYMSQRDSFAAKLNSRQQCPTCQAVSKKLEKLERAQAELSGSIRNKFYRTNDREASEEIKRLYKENEQLKKWVTQSTASEYTKAFNLIRDAYKLPLDISPKDLAEFVLGLSPSDSMSSSASGIYGQIRSIQGEIDSLRSMIDRAV